MLLLQSASAIAKTSLLAVMSALFVTLPAHAQIIIGQTTALSGEYSDIAKESLHGARLYLDKINSDGGVNGQRIELITMDDAADPARATANAKELIEGKNALSMFLSLGVQSTQAMYGQLSFSKTPLVGTLAGATSLHKPVNPFIFNVRTSQQVEIGKAINYLKLVGAARIAFVHENGGPGQEDARLSFAQEKLSPAVVLPLGTKGDIVPIAEAIEKSGAQGVVWVGSPLLVAEGIKLLRKRGNFLQNVVMSSCATSAFVKELGSDGSGVVVSQVFPMDRAQFVEEARILNMKQNGPPLTPGVLEGYASAKVLVEGIKRAGARPSRAKLLDALNSMHDYDLGGGKISYSANNHSGMEFVQLSVITKAGVFRR